MRLILLAAALLAAVPTAAQAAKARQAAPPLRADTSTCRTGVTPAERFAVFTGSMPARRGTDRMAMRFELQIREAPDTGYRTVKAPSFGRWERSQPGRRGFIYSKRVDGLKAPATYRTVVRYRWYDDAGAVIASATRTAPQCTQPDPRPNLRLLALRATAGPAPGTTTYLLTVVNSGRGPAAAFEVAAGPDDDGAAATVTVGGMAAREARVLEVTARSCAPDGRVRIRLDVGAVIAESSETDNDVRRSCPE
ncbi:hypothetical protein LRS13_11805 [Svornostia abyssi]|uniref:CARDB domain-containing protein n=1 Tax=Svornostia abyssi TaxID=2898438 RepID=A0ABY5PN84_9ACTN|nr:hypothetical protein LRS13_11805 [Parviterribacteraceae bacterium J379]